MPNHQTEHNDLDCAIKINNVVDKIQILSKQLRNLRTDNPKEYWKILNSGRHKQQPNISIENLLQFKKNLNGAPSNFDEIDISSLNDDMMNGQNYN